MRTAKPSTRRSLLAGALCGAFTRLSADDFDKPAPGSEHLTAYTTENQVVLNWNNAPLCDYRAHADQKYPFFHPLTGPLSGDPVTLESGLPYPHQRGLFLAWEPLNGGDYWTDSALDSGHIRSNGPKVETITADSAVISDSCRWERKDAPAPLEDTRRFHITVLNERAWSLDVALHVTALQDIVVKSAKHSLFTLRCAADLAPIYGGTLVSSSGASGARGSYGKKANWCRFFGPRRTAGHPVEGVVLMDHPANPWSPCPWFNRDYGSMSPSPFNFIAKPWTMQRGASLDLRYRVVVHAGIPRDAGIERLYRAWAG